MDILDVCSELGIELIRKAATDGGEWAGPCPFCSDGTDRFLVWPHKHNSDSTYMGGRFSCPRHCGEHGDAANLLMRFRGMNFEQACAYLKLQPQRDVHKEPERPKFYSPSPPPSQWLKKSAAFVALAHEQLLKNPTMLTKVLLRGFTINTVRSFKIGFNPSDQWLEREEWGLSAEMKEDGKPKKLWIPAGIVFPTFSEDDEVSKVKIRRPSFEEEMEQYEREVEAGKVPKRRPQKYVGVSGSMEIPAIYGDKNHSIALIMESESDALLAIQIAGDLIFSVGTGGSSKPIDKATYEILKRKFIVVCPDYDDGGITLWKKWRTIFPAAKKIHFPGKKSLGDAHAASFDVRTYLKEQLIKLDMVDSSK